MLYSLQFRTIMGTGGGCLRGSPAQSVRRLRQLPIYPHTLVVYGVIVPLTSTESNEEAIREISSLVSEVTFDIVYLVHTHVVGHKVSRKVFIYRFVCIIIFCYSSQSRTAKQG